MDRYTGSTHIDCAWQICDSAYHCSDLQSYCQLKNALVNYSNILGCESTISKPQCKSLGGKYDCNQKQSKRSDEENNENSGPGGRDDVIKFQSDEDELQASQYYQDDVPFILDEQNANDQFDDRCIV